MSTNIESTPFEDALEKTGNGLYNFLLVFICGFMLLAMGADLYGFGLAVVAACDLNITISQKGILTSLPFISILLVSYFWGYISDTRGRRFTLVVSMLAAFVFGCISSLATNWLLLGLFKFLSVCFSCSANAIAYTLAGESCVQRVRSKYMLLMTCMLILSPGIGALITYAVLLMRFENAIPLLGINFTPWRFILIVLAVPLGIAGAAIFFFHESPKFLANCGRKDEALKVLRSIHAINNLGSKEKLEISSFYLEESTEAIKSTPIFHTLFAQSAVLFRRPLLWTTLQLYFIVSVIYFTNNSLLVWLPYVMNMAKESVSRGREDFCTSINSHYVSTKVNVSLVESNAESQEICLGYVEDNVIIAFAATHALYAFFAFIISYLMRWRRIVLITVLSVSAISGAVLGEMTEPIASVFFFMVFASTNLGMGIMAAYFLDLYPTSCRGMASCLSIMSARTSAFIGINLIGNFIFDYCHVTFYLWSLLVFSSVIAAWFLAPDNPLKK